MSLLSLEELKTLVEQPQGVCTSIYMPTYRAGSETQQNPIRFKNLIKQAETQLQENHLSSTDALAILQPAFDLDRDDFWQHQDEGLAIFLANGFFRYYCLPLKFNELVVVSDRFHLKPLMPLLTGDGEFYILSLTKKQIRFFEANRYSINPVEVENMPQSMDEVLHEDEIQKGVQQRIATSKGGTANSFQQPGSFHGQGSPDVDKHQRDILQFCYAIDRALHEKLRNKQGPLILMGTENFLPLYREANTYPHLLEEDIPENPKILKPEELHAAAWPVVEPYFAQSQQQAIEHYRELTATGRTSTKLEEVVPAAFYGRVEQLFVAVGVQQWGSFDPQANALSVHRDVEPGDEDLLNTAAIQTVLNGGTVYAVEPDRVPDSAPLAAAFRY